MPVISDFSLSQREDVTLNVSISPPTAIGGQNLQFMMLNRFGGVSGIITKSVSSGFNNVSGINITNSGNGNFNVSIVSLDTSGLDFKPFAYLIQRLDTGNRTVISEGYVCILP